MVVPTVLAIMARRNCARCSASGNGLIVTSNVVILLLLGPYQTGTCGMRFLPHPRKWMRGSMSIFLLGPAPSLRADAHADCGRPILDGERRLPSAIAG